MSLFFQNEPKNSGSLIPFPIHSFNLHSLLPQYATPREHNERYWTFYRNAQLWERANREDKGTARYGPTQFADLSPAEFAEIYLNKVKKLFLF